MFTILKKKEKLTIPFSNLKELEVRNYNFNENNENYDKKKKKKKKKKEKEKEIYYLIAPISNYSGDIPLINTCRIDDSLILFRDYDNNELLLELKDNLLSLLTKFLP